MRLYTSTHSRKHTNDEVMEERSNQRKHSSFILSSLTPSVILFPTYSKGIPRISNPFHKGGRWFFLDVVYGKGREEKRREGKGREGKGILSMWGAG